MSENAIDSESKPAPDSAKPKNARKAGKKVAKKARAAKKSPRRHRRRC